eukprot:1308896-Pyramimonas_sp.AAC.1
MESKANMNSQVNLFGALPGVVRLVPRGELYILWVALRIATKYVTCVTDSKMVHDGWWSQKYLSPSGGHAEFWAKIGLLFRGTSRRPEHVTVLFTSSHLEAEGVV